MTKKLNSCIWDNSFRTFEEYVMLRLEEYTGGWDNISNGRRNYAQTTQRQDVYEKRLEEFKKKFCKK